MFEKFVIPVYPSRDSIVGSWVYGSGILRNNKTGNTNSRPISVVEGLQRHVLKFHRET